MVKNNWLYIGVLLLAGTSFNADAQLSVSAYFSSGMVIQRDQKIPVWGNGVPGHKITVRIGHDKAYARVAKDSVWHLLLPSRKASTVPTDLRIADGRNSLAIKDILIGDVWLCSGQSNMELELKKDHFFSMGKSFGYQPLIRLYNGRPAGRHVYGIAYNDSLRARLTVPKFYQGEWSHSDSLHAVEFSAIGYYFAKVLTDSLHIPIGIMDLSIGGAPIESFISREALKESTDFAAKVKGNWLANDHLPVWVRMRGMENVGQDATVFIDGNGPNHAYKPGFAYESGIAPMKLRIKGVLWYQGESNAQEIDRVREYKDLQKLLIHSYRHHFRNSRLPFYWVQLSSVDTTYYKSGLWPDFRNQQLALWMETAHSGMVVSHDIGAQETVHPIYKKEIGERLAKWALARDYHYPLVPSGPVPLVAHYDNGMVTITFKYTGKGLKIAHGTVLKGFSLDGIHPCDGCYIAENKIKVPASGRPAFIYYAWQSYTDANLVNSEQLPTTTFKLKVQ